MAIIEKWALWCFNEDALDFKDASYSLPPSFCGKYLPTLLPMVSDAVHSPLHAMRLSASRLIPNGFGCNDTLIRLENWWKLRCVFVVVCGALRVYYRYIQVKHSHKGPLLLTALTIYQFASLSKMSSSYATKLISIIGTQLSGERIPVIDENVHCQRCCFALKFNETNKYH